jgi:hypothetical protein
MVMDNLKLMQLLTVDGKRLTNGAATPGWITPLSVMLTDGYWDGRCYVTVSTDVTTAWHATSEMTGCP